MGVHRRKRGAPTAHALQRHFIVQPRTFTQLLLRDQVGGYARGSETNGKLGRYGLGGFVLEVYEDGPSVPNSTVSSSGSGGLETGRRSLKGVKKGKSDAMRASGPWASQQAFDMCVLHVQCPAPVSHVQCLLEGRHIGPLWSLGY